MKTIDLSREAFERLDVYQKFTIETLMDIHNKLKQFDEISNRTWGSEVEFETCLVRTAVTSKQIESSGLTPADFVGITGVVGRLVTVTMSDDDDLPRTRTYPLAEVPPSRWFELWCAVLLAHGVTGIRDFVAAFPALRPYFLT